MGRSREGQALTESLWVGGSLTNCYLVGMTGIRPYFAAVAWTVALAVLLAGLSCSLGHGLMMQAQSEPARQSFSGAGEMMEHHHHDSATKSGQHPSDKAHMSATFDGCVFAGSLLSATLVLAWLCWRLRHRRRRLLPPTSPPVLPFLVLRPGLKPRAP
ncbi:DUF2946 family protein [Pseudomonas oryzihabitans]|uniref:DUF2946 family protein n=2 Tax=Pseudomonas TaxID=286 RepID=UPI003B01E283